MLTYHQWSIVTFTWEQFHSAQAIIVYNEFDIYIFKITTTSLRGQWVKSFPPSAEYMHQKIGSALVQIMACHLFGAKPSPEPMLLYCQLDTWEHMSVKFESEFYHFHSSKCNWKCRLPKWRPFCPGGDELSMTSWPDLLPCPDSQAGMWLTKHTEQEKYDKHIKTASNTDWHQ